MRDCFTGNPFRVADAQVQVLQFKLGCQFQGMIIGRCGEKKASIVARTGGENVSNIFILHGSGRRPGEKKPRRSGAKDALSRPKPRRKSTGLGQLNLTRFPANCELIIAPNREKPRAASARSLTPFLEPRSLRLWPV